MMKVWEHRIPVIHWDISLKKVNLFPMNVWPILPWLSIDKITRFIFPNFKSFAGIPDLHCNIMTEVKGHKQNHCYLCVCVYIYIWIYNHYNHKKIEMDYLSMLDSGVDIWKDIVILKVILLVVIIVWELLKCTHYIQSI